MSLSRTVVAALLLASATPADAAIFVVTNANASGAGSLNQAIADANLTEDADVINFNIVSIGPPVKTIAGILPTITQPLTIDGYTQTGASKNTRIDGGTNAVLRIEIDAAAVTVGGAAIKVTNTDVTLRGLAIKNIPTKAVGIDIGEDAGAVVRGCFIGTNAAGMLDLSNGTGILVRGTASIGGSGVGDRNLISGNNASGVQLKGLAFGLLNNLIGTNANGEPSLGNGTGVQISASELISSVGGSSVETQNVFAGNTGAGFQILSSAAGKTSIAVNSFHDNGGLGIDLGATGVTPNDSGDFDSGANDLQNFPVLTFARANAATITAEGFLDSQPGTYRINFYRSFTADPSGFGEGQLFVDTLEVTIPEGGTRANFSAELSAGLGLGSTPVLTATAENMATASTSEFSQAIDILPGGQELAVTNTNDGGAGSLRQAILDANAAPDTNTIAFDIPGDGPHVLTPASGFALSAPVILDGYSQPGSLLNTLGEGSDAELQIVIDGSDLPAVTKSMITISSPDTVVRGLVLHSAPNGGIAVIDSNSGEGIRIEGCFVGTDETGMEDLGNGGFGVVISGFEGVVIGGPDRTQRNIISGNAGSGIVDASFGAVLLNNIVGGDATGLGSLGNGEHGISLAESGSTVGSDDAGAGNVIRHNVLAGIRVGGSGGHQILGNRISDNGGLGIDLEPELSDTLGVTENDIDDVDGGANDGQNFPEIFETGISPGSFEVSGQLDVPAAAAGAIYTLRFFANETCDPSGHGEGEFFIGAADVELSDGAPEFFVDLPASVKPDAFITATATDVALGNTSEFSECFGGPPASVVCGDASGEGDISASDALVALRTAVGAATCELCRCDVNGQNGITASDALLVLKAAVGQEVEFECGACV